ncbi:helix-turn-helix domain-containing protein [Aureimonas glaciei]|uniref:HTH cro/C1-type domain-containing protein n=1 Tax=Aureimonas glaciei TaxID=1776957 RepID=A0A916XUG6_9HYPH|nr:helix-turn-helix transcriptional regulator [Aureimonas glaciei]GGD11944.1 hypothetical protein GCM10011335_13600 [Aureimonas glaciei]
MTVGHRIRALRLAAGQTLDDVARGTRMHVALLRCLEAGRPASIDQLRAIARHFGVADISVTTGGSD